MKKEIKDIILVGTITFILGLGFILSAVLININAFTSGKKITLKINYANCSYEYKNVKTNGENLYEVLRDYNDKLALGLLVSGMEDETNLFSLKSTDINSSKHYSYLIKVNGELGGNNLVEIYVSIKDVISIDDVNTSANESQSVKLVEGGDKKLTYYFKVSVAVYIIAAIIVVPVLLYIILALIKFYKNNNTAIDSGGRRN